MALPDFTKDQRQRLANCGVLPEQIEQLRLALPVVKRALRAPAGRNVTKGVLTDVAKHANALAVLLTDMWNQVDAAHATALIEVEQRYWKARPDDIGPSSAHNVIPRLAALADAARDAMASLPKEQTRYRAAALPIKWIDDALLNGWIQAQGPREVRIIDGVEYKAALPPYPDAYHPHESKTFVEIVAICYEAAGAPPDYEPLAAIRAYVRGRKRRFEEVRAAVTAAISAAPAHRKVRLSAKRKRQ